jgi:hypothetical protein
MTRKYGDMKHIPILRCVEISDTIERDVEENHSYSPARSVGRGSDSVPSGDRLREYGNMKHIPHSPPR